MIFSSKCFLTRCSSAPPTGTHANTKAFSYTLAEITRINNEALRDKSTDQILTALGISEELQAVLTNPAHRDLFLSEKLAFWLNDTITLGYGTLIAILEKLKLRAAQTVARRNGENIIPSAESNSDVLSKTYVTVQNPPRKLEDHYTYYKGTAVEQMGFGMLIEDNGSIFLDAFVSSSGKDWHFTTEEPMAERYREWAAARSLHSETTIIQIQVLKTIIEGLQEKGLCYSTATHLDIRDLDAVDEIANSIRGKIFLDMFPAHVRTSRLDISVHDALRVDIRRDN